MKFFPCKRLSLDCNCQLHFGFLHTHIKKNLERRNELYASVKKKRLFHKKKYACWEVKYTIETVWP